MKASRSLLITSLVVAFGHSVVASLHQRQSNTAPAGGVSTPPPPLSLPTTTSLPPTPTPTPVPPTSTPTTTSTTSNIPPPSDTSKSSDTPTSTPTPDAPPTSTPPPPPPTSLSVSTNPAGVEVTLTVTTTSSSTSSAAPSTTSNKSEDDSAPSSGIGIGPIIGMSVAGGVAVIAIIAFFVWKFTRKRFSDFDDNEAIKWPELNSHGGNVDSHPLPVHNTGRSGFDTGSEASLSRVPSSSNYSTPDIGGGGPDPYAVPPLPHMNPNQPYRDDPTAATGYYDPYRGPIPGTLEHGAAAEEWHGEAIPMTQMAAGPQGGRMSPGPQAAYGGEYDVGRQSPGPQAAYGGRHSPGPQAAYGGGRVSPGPQAAYNAARMSPGPQASYDTYGGR